MQQFNPYHTKPPAYVLLDNLVDPILMASCNLSYLVLHGFPLRL